MIKTLFIKTLIGCTRKIYGRMLINTETRCNTNVTWLISPLMAFFALFFPNWKLHRNRIYFSWNNYARHSDIIRPFRFARIFLNYTAIEPLEDVFGVEGWHLAMLASMTLQSFGLQGLHESGCGVQTGKGMGVS
jgi:hypothetical protein